MSRFIYLFLIICLSWSACKKDPEPPTRSDQLLTHQALADFIQSASEANNLITEASFTADGFLLLKLESGTVSILAELIKEANPLPATWEMEIICENGQTLTGDFLGNTDFMAPDDITLDPFGVAPLSAQAEISSPVKGRFEVEVPGKGSDGISISHTFASFSEEHVFPILGLYAEYDNPVELRFLDESGNLRVSKTLNVTTDKVFNIPEIDVIKNQLPSSDQGIYQVAELRMGFDQQGEIRWYYRGEHQLIYRQLSSGQLIISSNKDIYTYHPKYFSIVSTLGEIEKTYEVPNHLHHDVNELPNGNLLAASNSYPIKYYDGLPEEDMVIEIDRESGQIIKQWDFNAILDSSRVYLPSSRSEDWMHLNAVSYDPEDNSIIVSSRSQSVVAKVDYDTGDLIWILGSHAQWKPEFQPYLLQPVDAQGDSLDVKDIDFWGYGQHAPKKLPNGNYLVYDNGDHRGFYQDETVSQESYSRGVEYKIDEQNMTVELVWQYRHNPDIFTIFTGDVDYLEASGNRLVGFMWQDGNAPKVVEINSQDEVVFEVNINPGAARYYRVEKVDLYRGY